MASGKKIGDAALFNLNEFDKNSSNRQAQQTFNPNYGQQQQQQNRDTSWNAMPGYSAPKPLDGGLPGPGPQNVGCGYPQPNACEPPPPACAPPPCAPTMGLHFNFHTSMCRKLFEGSFCPCAQSWKPCALLAEFLGALLFVHFVVGASLCVCGVEGEQGWILAKLLIGITAGFIVFALIASFGPISGGHFSPHVTLTLLFCGKINAFAALLYMLMQLIGSIVGAALLLIFYDSDRCCLGTPHLGRHVSIGTGLAAEIIGTFLIILVVLFAMENAVNSALTIGLAVTVAKFLFLPFSGSSFDFFYFLAPAIFSGCWDNWWIYLVGPLIGGFLAWLVYKICCMLRCWGGETPEYVQKGC